jgi:hypothetical protein
VSAAQLAALAALGAFHGLNPAMGWLFAVARGMQERSRWALLRSLPPIAAGHLASVAIVAAVVSATRSVLAANVVGIAGGVLLVGYGLWRLLSERHFRWAGMRLSLAQLAGGSFLMSSAHGAGLMVAPVLLGGGRTEEAGAASSDHALAMVQDGAMSIPAGALAIALHVGAMVAVMGVVALVVYEKVGVAVLRKAWVNLDGVWAGAFVVAGVVTLLT